MGLICKDLVLTIILRALELFITRPLIWFLKIVTFLLTAPLFILFYVWHLLIRLLIWYRYGNSVQIARGGSAYFAEDEPEWLSLMLASVVIEGDFDEDCVDRLISKGMKILKESNFSIFTKKLKKVYGYWCFVDSAETIDYKSIFELQNKRIDQNKIYTDKDIAELLCELYYEKDPSQRLTGKILVLKKFRHKYELGVPDSEVKPKYVLLGKVNHVYGDGFSTVRALGALFIDEDIDIDKIIKVRKFSSWEMAIAYTLATIQLPFLFYEILVRYVAKYYLGKLPPKLTGKKRIAFIKPIYMTDIKEIRKRTDTAFCDVILSAISESFYKYFKKRSMSSQVQLGAATFTLPLSKEIKMQNNFGAAPMRYYVGDMDPLIRLMKSKKENMKMKRSLEYLSFYLASSFWSSIIPSSVSKHMSNFSDVFAIWTNLPLFQEPIHTDGKLILENKLVVPHRDRSGVSICLCSYCGKLYATYMVDEAVVKDDQELEEMVNGFNQHIEDLLTCTDAHCETKVSFSDV